MKPAPPVTRTVLSNISSKGAVFLKEEASKARAGRLGKLLQGPSQPQGCWPATQAPDYRMTRFDMENTGDEISLQEIFSALRARRTLIILLTMVSTALAAGISFVLPEKFEVSVVLAPVDDEAGGKLAGAGALLSQFGGLASLGGFNVGGSGKKAEYIATLQSHALTEAFITDRDLLPMLYPSKWDASSNRWKETDPDEIPTPWKAEKKFATKIRTISEDKKSGLVTLTITWTDPEIAADWATDIVKRANSYLRAKAIARSNTNLEYLNEQLTKTSVVELQKSIYALIEAEIKKVMIANGSDEFAFRVIDPARAPEERSSPKRALITAVGAFAGLMLGVLLALSLPIRVKD